MTPELEQQIRGLSAPWRRARMRRFVEVCRISERTSVVDVGGTQQFWKGASPRPALTIVNMDDSLDFDSTLPDTFVCADALRLPFDDASFDVAFSNSAIEHVGTWGNQRRFADEIRRVARSYWVQTPWRWFPIEPHYLTPFIHWLPRSVRRRLVRWTLLAAISRTRRSGHWLEDSVDEIRLLTRGELTILFPDALIEREKLLGLTKSYIATRVGP